MFAKSNCQLTNIHLRNHISRYLATPSATRQNVFVTNDRPTEYANALPISNIPGPSAVSLILSNLPGGIFYKKDFREMLRLYRQQYGDLMKIPSVFGKPEIVFTYNPEHFQAVFRTEGQWPKRQGLEALKYHREKVRPDVYGKHQGLVNTQDEEWGKFRSAVNPVMVQPKNTKRYIPNIDEVAGDFIQRVKRIRNPSNNQLPENFEAELNRWAFESIGVVALDTRLRLISDTPNEKAVRFMVAVKELIKASFVLDIQPSIWRIFPTPTFKKFLAETNMMTDIAADYITEARRRLQSNPTQSQNDQEQSVLEKLLQIDETTATVMAMDMCIAGVDTTSSAFTGTLYLLAKHPDKQQILRNEIMTVLPQKESHFTIESMRRLPYLRACIKEAQRLFPTVLGNARSAGQDLVLDGYQIPKGTQVLMCGTALATEEKYYSQAMKFLPERWLKQETAQGVCPIPGKSTHPFVYLPFGFGPRMCIGRRFAEMEIEILISKLIRNFLVSWEHEDLKFKSQTINMPDSKLMFTLLDLDE